MKQYKEITKRLVLDDIEITVTKKKIKHLYIRILPEKGEVRVSAPWQMSDEAVERFARSRIDWIRTQRKRLRQEKKPDHYMEGEIHYLWGNPYILKVREGSPGSVRTDGKQMILTAPSGSTEEEREKICREWYRDQLNKNISRLREACEKTTGVHAEEWRTKNMRTRWGTCNVQKRRIWLSLELARKPVQCLEYVMIHELTHLLERSHNVRFWKLMDQFCPDWKSIRARLNQREEAKGS